MSGDYSRITFDPGQDDLGVLLQQGRPLSDADWNALALQLRRRIHVGTLDTIGAAVVPLQTPEGFRIDAVAGNLTIGRGRLYVDGLLAENHGGGDAAWDARLEERFGTQPMHYRSDDEVSVAVQPYYPDAPALPETGRHLAYLDVWQREVTSVQRPELIEKAIGVDSTTRLQTVWQVKLLEDVGADVGCSTPLDEISGWLPANAPSAGRVSTATAAVPGQPDPCLIPPGDGYKGLENQLYRIEIHQGGGLGEATFKWSRDNASVETRVTHIPAPNQLTVESVGKDAVLRFSDGDWVEISDDWRELHNLPGELRRIKIGGGVDDATRTILLETPLTAGLFPTDAMDRTQPGRHTRVKRWDQRGPVFDRNGNVLQDLDPAASTGEITVPAGAGVGVLLEHGIVATFSLASADGRFRSGDHWIFAARSADTSIEELDQAPPRGIHHHYAKLGFVELPGGASDCRVFWPPPDQVGEGGDSCACTVCVSPERHASGELTLQKAVDMVREARGGTICLEAGVYRLDAALDLTDTRSLRMVGKGQATQLQAEATAFRIEKARDLVLESFAVDCMPGNEAADAAVRIASSREVVLDRLWINVRAMPSWSSIAFRGGVIGVGVRRCTLRAGTGISAGRDKGDAENGEAGLTDLTIDDNLFQCENCAVRFDGVSVHDIMNRLHGNRVLGCRDAGFVLTGVTAPDHGVEISDNLLNVFGDGIRAGIDGLRITGNSLIFNDATDPEGQCGVRLVPGLKDKEPVVACRIVDNRITGFPLAGIVGSLPALEDATIGRNRFERVGEGLVFDDVTQLQRVSIENNQFSDVAGSAIRGKGRNAQLVIAGNQIDVDGRAPAVEAMYTVGNCVFSHNQCRSREAGEQGDVILGADTLIVASNRVEGGPVSMRLYVDRVRMTVLGNVVRGKLLLMPGSAALSVPWAPLNQEGV